MLQFKKKRREGGLLKITTSNINSAQCFQVLLLWRLHPTAGVSNDRGSQLCFPLCVFSCRCLSSVAPPHMLEHMRVPSSDTHINRSGPDVGGKGGRASHFLTAFYQVTEIPGKWHQRGLHGGSSALSLLVLGRCYARRRWRTSGLGKHNHPSGWVIIFGWNKHAFTNWENPSEAKCQCTASWWKSRLKIKYDIWTDVIYLKVCSDYRINI